MPTTSLFAQWGQISITALARLGGAEQPGVLRQVEAGNEEALRVALRAARLRVEPKERLY